VFAGESVEEAVRREVAEEVGLEVERLEYSASQHWPFPNSSLMIACHATVKPGQTEVSSYFPMLTFFLRFIQSVVSNY
jgi:NADH pyrophosphatase NudC (nudix superfamily)